MTERQALTIVASLCADGVLDEKEEAILRKALAFPQRTWVGLTWEDANEIAIEHDVRPSTIKAIEAKLKEKNT